jgi:hypothetical protein
VPGAAREVACLHMEALTAYFAQLLVYIVYLLFTGGQ